MLNYNQKIIEILSNSNSWSVVKSKLELYNTSQTETTSKDTEAGKLFEHFAKAYFIIEPEQNHLYKQVWLFDEIPLKTKEQLSFPLRDFGIDLLLEDYQNRYYAVQCKFKNDEQSVLQWSKDKLGNAFGLAEKCDHVLIFTNASNIHTVAREREKLKFIGLSDLIEIKTEVLEGIKAYFETHQAPTLHKNKPKPHQVIAINKTIKYFENNERGQLILPCGAGKTLTALWIKEELNSNNTLVLFPSLALLRQFKNEWSWHRNSDFEYICVCSEKDIDRNTSDTTITHTYEISGEVTTQPNRISKFLEKPIPKIVYSTYQSIEAIEEALKNLPTFSFDLIICDEAHRTAGSKINNQFTIVHNNNRIRSKKRLYMTATPKVVSNSLKSRLGDDYDLLCDMSNPEIFGNESYRMSFGEAIQKDILVDYKIIGIGVTHKQVKEFIDQRRYINSKYSIDEIAHNYALDNVMNKYNASHSISFHSKVQFAKEFVDRHNTFFQGQVYSQYVEGNQPTSYRVSVLNQFKNSEKGVVCNARCLTEGVDVPTIDLIYFCDPKTSKIDIVQASGRALRTDRHSKKTEGYIVVPIFHYKDDDVEKEIESKPYFLNLVSVIRSLCDQDERLQAEIDEIAFNKSKKQSKHIHITYNDNEIERIIKLDGLEEKVKDYLFDQIIEKTRNYWELMFNQLLEYKKVNGNLNVSRVNEDTVQLGNWVLEQRRQYHLGKIRQDRKKRLEEIDFDWKGENRREINDPDEIWKQNYNKLVDYFNEHGNSDVPARYTKDKPLGTWCVSQRVKYDEERLADWQLRLLEDISFKWDPKNKFDKYYSELIAFKEKHGHVKVPTSGSKEYKALGRWVNRLRVIYNCGTEDENGNILTHKVGSIKSNHFKKLKEIGFIWNAGRGDWNDRFEELESFFIKNGNSNVSQSDDMSLYYWCYRQRKAENELTPEKKEKLKSVDFDYSVRATEDKIILTWGERIEQLKEYFNENSNYDIPKENKNFKTLINWLRSQRRKQLNGKLTKEQETWFKTINFSLEGFFNSEESVSWDTNLARLEQYFQNNKTFYIPTGDKIFSTLLYWIRYQRSSFNHGKLDKEKENKLRAIGYSFESNYKGKKGNNEPDKIWYNKLDELKNYYSKHSTFQLSENNNTNKSLINWVRYQRSLFRTGKLGETKTKLLEEIKFPFNEYLQIKSLVLIKKEKPLTREIKPSLWNKRFEEFKLFYDEHKTFLIPPENKELQTLLSWIRYQRVLFREGKLEKAKIKKLNELGYSFDLDFRGRKSNNDNFSSESWEANLSQLEEYFKKNGTFLITKFDSENAALLQWLRYQRLLKKQGKLSIDKLKAFEDIGYSFDLKYYGQGKEKKLNVGKEKSDKNLKSWENNYLKLLEYKMLKGNCNVPRGYEVDKALSNFVVRQRTYYRHGKLNDAQIKKLEFLGFEWEVNRKESYFKVWQRKYFQLVDVYNKTGNSHITKHFNDISLYTWVLQQRMKKRNGDLTNEQIGLLDKIEFSWNPEGAFGAPDDEQWFTMLQELEEYKIKFGDCNVSQLDKVYMKLGRWLNDQRLNFAKGKLIKHRKELLEEIGIIWNIKEYEWELKLKMLKDFQEKYGHFDVKQSDIEFGGLYDWLYKMKKKGTTEQRRKKLEEVGFDTTIMIKL